MPCARGPAAHCRETPTQARRHDDRTGTVRGPGNVHAVEGGIQLEQGRHAVAIPQVAHEDAYLAALIPLPVGSLNCDFPVVAPEADLWTFPIDAPCEDPAAIGPFLGLGGVVHPVQRVLLDAGDPRGRHLHGEHDHLREDLGRIE